MRWLDSFFVLGIRPLTVAGLSIAAISAGCGSDDVETIPPPVDAGDGRYHPPPNGTQIDEDPACQALASAQGNKRLMLGCVGTTAVCPGPLRSQFGTACMKYDQGSVQGCIDHYNKQTTCPDFNMAVTDCVVTPYPGTEPTGCP
jgi:hypothetical protein